MDPARKPLHPSPLADLLGEPETRLEFGTVHDAARRALVLIRAALGEPWVSRHCAKPLLDELNAPPLVTVAKRLSDRAHAHALFGANVASTYAVFGIEIAESMPSGWRVLQAIVFAGLLVRKRVGSFPGANHISAVSQFLTGTVSLAATRTGTARAKFLSELTASFDLGQVVRSTQAHAPDLPEGFVKGVGAIAKGIGSSRQRGDVPPPPPISVPGVRGPAKPKPPGVVEIVDYDEENEVIAGASEALTQELRDACSGAAEAAAEQVAAAMANVIEPEMTASHRVREAISRRLFLDVSQGLWARLQWDALAPPEMTIAVSAWKARAGAQLQTGDLPGTEAALLVLLTGCTGWPDERVWATPFLASGEPMPKDHDRAFVYDSGEMVFPVPSDGEKYVPKEEHQPLLLPVTSCVRLRLPSDIASLIRRYVEAKPADRRIWMTTELGQLRSAIRGIQSHERSDEPRETVARIRNGHLLQLLTSSQDLALSQIACGELLGASDVGLTYYTTRTCDVQRSYDAACTAHGYSASEGLTDLELVGGSRLQLPPQVVHDVVEHLRKGHGQRNGRKSVSATEALRVHRTYAPAVAWQFCAATLMRPGDSIGSLMLANISFSHRAAVVADKVVDEGHLGRLVPLPDLLVETLEAYGHHLFALSKQSGVAESIRKAARDALDGTGPLFFVIRNGRAKPLALEDLRRRLPRGWPLPKNFLRHRYASLLREIGCPAPYVEAVMGHVEMGAQPFGSESFMDPVAYVEETRKHIQELLLRDGFKPLYGLSAEQEQVWYAAPLGDWVLELRSDHREAIDKIREEHRQRLEKYRNEAANEVAGKVSKVLLAHLPDFFTGSGGRIDKELGKKIRKALTDPAESIAESQVLVERLREEFVAARNLRQWKITRLPYFHRGKVEASPVATSYPRAADAFAALRDYFADVLNGKRKAPRTFTSRVRLILALILWHGVSDWRRLEALLRNLNRGQLIDGLGDAVAVPIPLDDDERHRETAEVLRGRVALAAVPFIGAPQEFANKRRLGEEVHRCLPSWIASGDERKFLDVLLEAAAISHAFENPAVIRDVWTNAASSITMSVERMERLFSSRAIPLTSFVATDNSSADRVLAACPLPAGHATEFRHYRRLRDMLRVKNGREKNLPYQGIKLPVDAPKKRVRDEILSELRIHETGLLAGDTPVRLLTLYARKLLERGTPTHAKIEPETVYQYVVGVGAFLVRLHARAVLTETESEGLLEIYTDVVRAVPRGYQASVAKYLSYFHRYLVAEHDAVPVDLRGIGGYLAGIPDVGFVAPTELVQAKKLLVGARDQAQSASIHICHQAQDVLELGFATGARSSEIVLREQRELVAEAGRATLLVRRNRMTGTKTERGVRPLSLEGWMPAPDVARIKHDAQRLADRPRAPLFPDSDDPSKPTDPGAIAAATGAALRAATGDESAHLYWLRHTAASMELLHLFGDAYLLDQVNRGEGGRVPFPFGTKEHFAILLGGSAALSLVHSSAYRGRRGHASIRTGQTSYIHVVGLIEPWASRTARKSILGEGRAALLGRGHAWVRQIVSRAKLVSTEDAQVTRALLEKLLEPSLGDKAPEPQIAQLPLTNMKIRDVFRCVSQYFNTGEIRPALATLRSTRLAEQRAAEFLTNSRVKPSSPIRADRRAMMTLVEASSGRAELFVGAKSLDAEMVEAGLRYLRAHAKADDQGDALWQSILDGIDPENMLVRFKTLGQLKAAIMAFNRVFPSPAPRGKLTLVIDRQVSDAVVEREIAADPELAAMHVCRDRVPAWEGHIPLSLTYVTQKGQFRLATLALLAISCRLWRELRS